MSAPTRRDIRRQLEYARALVGPPRTEASINSELDRPREDRETHRDGGDPPVLQVKRSLSSVVTVLEYLLSLVDLAERWLPYVAVVTLLLVGGVSLAVGASLGAAVAVHTQLQQEIGNEAVNR